MLVTKRPSVRSSSLQSIKVARPELGLIKTPVHAFEGSRTRSPKVSHNQIIRQTTLEAARLLRQWGKPLSDLGFDSVSLLATASTDHVDFDTAGLPGFQFVHDRRDSGSRRHHTSLDTYERLSDRIPNGRQRFSRSLPGTHPSEMQYFRARRRRSCDGV